jgi:hypothetical protein
MRPCPGGHDTTLDFLLHPTSAPLLVQGGGLGAMTPPPGHPSVSTDDESLILVTNPVRQASLSTRVVPHCRLPQCMVLFQALRRSPLARSSQPWG